MPRARSGTRTAAKAVRPRLRLAGPDDMGVLVRQRRAMFQDMGHGDVAALDRADRVYALWFRRQRRLKRIQAIVAELPGLGVVSGGVVWLQERQPWPGFAGGLVPYLMSVYTEPAVRGRGIASAVVARALAWCRGDGARLSGAALQADDGPGPRARHPGRQRDSPGALGPRAGALGRCRARAAAAGARLSALARARATPAPHPRPGGRGGA